MKNYRIIVQYDGSRYKGWQIQKNTDMTIQGKLEDVLKKMTGQPIEVHGSGRTDAGVHAIGQTANFKLPKEKSCRQLRAYLNEYLPEDIAVLSVETVPMQFHSRLSAVDKTYRYRLWASEIPNVFERKYLTTWTEPLDIKRMQTAAELLVGTHDFTSFCGNRHFKKSAVRTIYAIEIRQIGGELRIDVTGNGFLQNMMRILIGTLVDVGAGRTEPSQVSDILESLDRERAGVTMPAKGLCLMEVRYGDKTKEQE